MQKKIIALAIAAISAAPAFAQSNVTIYGRADYGYKSSSGDDGASPDRDRKNEFASGIGAGSRIGFKGSEDLGNGLKAIFQMEFGMGLDASSTSAVAGGNTATWWMRNSYVGVTGNFGTVVGGRLDGVRYGIFNKYDAFGGGYSGNFTQMTAQVDRAENAIAYISPKFMGGFDLTLAYATHIGGSNPLGMTTQEGSMASTTNPLRPAGSTGNDGDAGLTTIKLTYGNGPISVDLDWERVNFKSGGQRGGTVAVPTLVGSSVPALHDNITVWTVAGSYDFGMVKVAALYDNLQSDVNSFGRRVGQAELDVDSWFLSASIPFGNLVGKITYGETENDNANSSEAQKWGLGVQYNLSKRTNVYANYGKISNDNGAAYQISTSANSQGGGYGVKGIDVGLAHSF